MVGAVFKATQYIRSKNLQGDLQHSMCGVSAGTRKHSKPQAFAHYWVLRLLLGVLLTFSKAVGAPPAVLAPQGPPSALTLSPPSKPPAPLISNPDPGVYQQGITSPQDSLTRSLPFGFSSSPSSSSSSQEEPGIDPSSFPRYIDFSKPNSSSMEFEEKGVQGYMSFDGQGASDLVYEENNEEPSGVNEIVFPAPSRSPLPKRSLSASSPIKSPLSRISPRSPSPSPSPSPQSRSKPPLKP